MSQVSLQKIFNSIISGETKEILFVDKKEYESFRVAILRKYKQYKEIFEKMGADSSYESQYLKCSFDSIEVKGTFKLEEDARKSNKPKRTYEVRDL